MSTSTTITTTDTTDNHSPASDAESDSTTTTTATATSNTGPDTATDSSTATAHTSPSITTAARSVQSHARRLSLYSATATAASLGLLAIPHPATQSVGVVGSLLGSLSLLVFSCEWLFARYFAQRPPRTR